MYWCIVEEQYSPLVWYDYISVYDLVGDIAAFTNAN